MRDEMWLCSDGVMCGDLVTALMHEEKLEAEEEIKTE